MREQKFITRAQEAAARRERPRIQPYRSPADPRAGWAKDYLRQQFRNEFGGDHPPEWRVYTGFVPALQEAAERAIAAGVRRRSDRRPAARGRVGRPRSAERQHPRHGRRIELQEKHIQSRDPLAPSGRIRVQAVRVYRGVVERVQSRDGTSNLDSVSALAIRSGVPRT